MSEIFCFDRGDFLLFFNAVSLKHPEIFDQKNGY